MKKNLFLLCCLFFSASFAFAEKTEEAEKPNDVEISICEIPGITQTVNYITATIKVDGGQWSTLYTAHYIPKQCYVSIKVSSPANTVFSLYYGSSSCAWWYSSAGNLDFCADGNSGDQIVFKTNTDVNSYVFRLQ